MTDDTAHPIAVAAGALAADYPLLLSRAGHPPATTSGTIGRQPNVHGIPGGTAHHDLSREVSDTVWGYVRLVDDLRDLHGTLWRNAVMDNARRVAVHAEALVPSAELADRLGGDPSLPCAGHARAGDDTGTRWHGDVAAHLKCLAHRVRLHLDPPGPKEFVGPCPTDVDGATCGHDVRARDGEPGRCTAGHVHDAATLRVQALDAVRGHALTLRQVADGSLGLFGKRVELGTLRQWVTRARLAPVSVLPDGTALVHADDVRALIR